MNYIYTTQTVLSTIKKGAKKHVKQSNKSIELNVALDRAATDLGYDNFRHANECLKKTPPDLLKDTPPLPLEYQLWAKQMRDMVPVSKASQLLFSNGFLFGFNDKDADEECNDSPIFIECTDGASLIFDDMARDWLNLEDEETHIKNINGESIEQNQEYILNEINRLRYFAPSPATAPSNITELKQFLLDNVFFYPESIWFKKRLIWQQFVESELNIP